MNPRDENGTASGWNWWQLLYNIVVVPFTYLLARMVGVFNLKVRENLQAREGHFRQVVVKSRELKDDRPKVWFHCASMGEYEALVPLLELIRQAGTCQVILTFFSTSGLNHFRDYHLIDLVAFAPLDFRKDVRRFLDLINPDIFVVTKHDIWPNTVWETSRQGIPSLLINGNFHPGTLRLKPLFRNFFHNVFAHFETILPVTSAAADMFHQLLPAHRGIAEPGETRYDRVLQRLQISRDQQDSIPAAFCEGNFVFIAGSTWPPGQERLLTACNEIFKLYPHFRLIMVPHEPLPAVITKLEATLAQLQLTTIRYSNLNENTTANETRVIIVDKVGLLAGLYRYADAAYVGGGFTTGVHSVIEPAAFSVPVMFGPRYGVSAEATQLLVDGGGFTVKTAAEIESLVSGWLREPQQCIQAGAAALAVVKRNSGTTTRIHELLKTHLNSVTDPHANSDNS
jgi:3-deoxy-D-manno-octulosonic-acid transferase